MKANNDDRTKKNPSTLTFRQIMQGNATMNNERNTIMRQVYTQKTWFKQNSLYKMTPIP